VSDRVHSDPPSAKQSARPPLHSRTCRTRKARSLFSAAHPSCFATTPEQMPWLPLSQQPVPTTTRSPHCPSSLRHHHETQTLPSHCEPCFFVAATLLQSNPQHLRTPLFHCKSPAGHKTNLRNSARRDALLRIFWTLGPLSGQTNHDCNVARKPTQRTNSTSTTVSWPLPSGCRCDSPASSCTSNFVGAPAQQSMSPSCPHQNILHLILL
jgi:hypothetical protein